MEEAEKDEDINIIKNAKLKQKLHNAKQITRSLDEAAFQREFNAKHRNTELTSSSVMQLQDELTDLVTQRRKSFDFTRPKALNQPKLLAGMSIATANRTILEQSMENECNRTVDEVEEYEQQQSPEILITPTTEASALDFSNPNLLSGVKLDRERIDRIKEERRQQLTQKYGMKSRSKTELNTDMNFNKDILKARSKSRGDISDFELDRDDNYLSSSDMNLMQCKRNEDNQIRLSQNRKSISLCQKQTQQQNADKNVNIEIDMKNATTNNSSSSAYASSNDRKQRELNKEHAIKRTVLKADDNIKQKYASNDLTTTKSRIHASSSSLNNDKSVLLTTNKTKAK